MKVKFFNPGLWVQKYPEMMTEIERVLQAGDLILRGDVERFEQNLAHFCKTKYAVALNSGTDALYLSLWALGIGAGDEVIVPSHTFVATAQVIVQRGAKPVLVDMNDEWEKHITEKTKAVIPAHIGGAVLDWKPHGSIPVIDDSCQALGAEGLQGLIQCWSFYPAKILGAVGDAGGITTNNEALYRKIKELRNHCKTTYDTWGINSRMDNLQAAVLNVKMKYLPQTLERRQKIADMYSKALIDIGDIIPPLGTHGRVWQDYIIYTQDRDALFNHLSKNGVETMKNEYPMPIPKLPRADFYEKHTLRLPINEVLTDEEVQYVIETIQSFYG